MFTKIKDFLRIGQLETLFGIKLKSVVVVFIILECIAFFFLECAASVLYVSQLNHTQSNELINTTYKISVMLDSGSE